MVIQLKSKEEIDFIGMAASVLTQWVEDCCESLEIGYPDTGLQIVNNFYDDLVTTKSVFPDSEWETPFSWQSNGRENGKFVWPICISVNDEIVHSKPNDKPFKTGDVITIDAGLSYNGWCADMARTVIYGRKGSLIHHDLIAHTQEAIDAAIKVCKPGNKINDISEAIWTVGKKYNHGIVVDYMGHGIGKSLHEEPRIPNIPNVFNIYKDIILRPGMVFCLEPMFTLGTGKTTLSPDGWKVWTADGSIAVHLEDQIVITENGCEVLT